MPWFLIGISGKQGLISRSNGFYDTSKFSEDAQYVMRAVERFFTFEFYIRYLKQNHREDVK